MDFPENLPSLSSDMGRLEQIVSHFFPKALHIVLDSRIPSLQSRALRSRSSSNVKKSDKWFNLIMGDRPAALEKLHSWHRNILDSMIIDIILIHPTDDDHRSSSSETVIERWVVQYENPLIMSPQTTSDPTTRYQKVYKKAIILLRSLHAQTRLLPAYRASRQLTSSSLAPSGYEMVYKVSSFSDVFSPPVTETMKEFRFSPVEVPPGRLCASVTYRSDLSDFNLGAHITLPPRIIADYVGSPATDPMRFFPSPGQSFEATSFQGRAGGRPPLMTTTSATDRPHSWTSGFHRPPTPNQSFSPDFLHWSRTDGGYGGDSHHHYHQLSPPFSPSGSPRGSNSSPRIINVRPGTAPVTIPSSATFNRYVSSNFSEPSRNPLPPFSPKSTRRSPSSQDSLSGIALYKISRSGESPSGLMNHYPGHNKLTKDSKYDSGRFSGLLSSSGSPRFGFSRSPSRLSSQDDLDDPDCSCPFDFDDVDDSGLQYSQSLDRRKTSSSISQSLPIGRKSQDAAVGVLVQMLKTAPPLRQDSSTYMASMSGVQREGSSVSGTESEFSMARSTSDALEELRNYKQLKDLLLSKSKNVGGATRVH
ncbi:hypothetical protein Bca4012_035772 [Brassica carinata]